MSLVIGTGMSGKVADRRTAMVPTGLMVLLILIPEDVQLSDAACEAFAKWWGINITAINPEPGHERSAISLPHSLQDSNIGHLSAILQRHHCSDTYCLRKEIQAVLLNR